MSAVATLELPRYEVAGKPPASAPVIIALGGISANRRISEWWPGIAGERCAPDTGREREAVAIARALAITTYRSAQEFEDRFAEGSDVERYLFHNAERFARTFSAHRYLALSLSSDTHHVDASRITAVTTLVAAEGDSVVPRAQLERLGADLAGPSRIVDLPGKTGHDA